MSAESRYSALVVDDDENVRDTLILALQNEGFDTKFASNGRMAANLVKIYQPDVVITDLRMPHMHGHDLISGLLEQESPPLIVAMTGVCEPRLVKDLICRGAHDVLFKPFSPQMFAAKLYAQLKCRGQAP